VSRWKELLREGLEVGEVVELLSHPVKVPVVEKRVRVNMNKKRGLGHSRASQM